MKSKLTKTEFIIQGRLKGLNLTDNQISSVVEIFEPALDAAIDAIYFDNRNDYLPALFEIITLMTGITNLDRKVVMDLWEPIDS